MNKFMVPSLAVVMMLMTSCFGDEPLNAECDIETVSIHVENPEEIFYHEYDTLQTVSSVVDSIGFLARHRAAVSSFPLTLTITEGATAYILMDGEWTPFQNGQDVDFSDERVQRFKVVSQSKAWHREYKICIEIDKSTTDDELVFTFDFDGNYELSDPTKTEKDNNVYYIWTETDEQNVNELFLGDSWQNGNPGFKLSKSSALPLEYPSIPVRGGGPDGSDCVKMETMDTGAFGKMVNVLMASGSMFNGYFDVTNALSNARKATYFGLPFKHKPLNFTVWLKFEAGETFQDKDGKVVPGVVDEPDAYVVVYRNQDAQGNRVQLDGDDVLTSEHIIGMARLPHRYDANGELQLTDDPIHGVTNEWKQFSIDVEYTEEPDPDILANNGYNMIIGFSSSVRGAYFEGAVGTKLWMDNAVITCE